MSFDKLTAEVYFVAFVLVALSIAAPRLWPWMLSIATLGAAGYAGVEFFPRRNEL